MDLHFVIDDGPVDAAKVLAYGILRDLQSFQAPDVTLRLVRTTDPSAYPQDSIVFGTGGIDDPKAFRFDPKASGPDATGPLRSFWSTFGPYFVSYVLNADHEEIQPEVVAIVGETLIDDIGCHAATPDLAPHGHVVRHVADTVFADDPYEDRFRRNLGGTADTLRYVLEARIRSVYRALLKEKGLRP